MADPILILVCTVVTLVGVPGMLLYSGVTWTALRVDIWIFVGLWIAVGSALWLSSVLVDGFVFLIPAMGIVASAGVSAVFERSGIRASARQLMASAFSLLVFLPLSLVVFGWGGTWLYRDAGALDFAGALPFALGAGVFVAVFARARRSDTKVDRPFMVAGALLLAAAMTGCAVGMELRVDELTPAIALNMLSTPVLAMLAAAGVERLEKRHTTQAGLATGLLAGTVAALASCAYLEILWAPVLGVLAGLITAIVRRGEGVSWSFAAPLVMGGATGVLFLGIFAIDVGFAYSGQLVFLLHQAILLAVGLVFAGSVSALITLAVRRRAS